MIDMSYSRLYNALAIIVMAERYAEYEKTAYANSHS